MADLVAQSGMYLGLETIRWGAKKRDDDSVRDAGSMVMLHFLPDPVGRLFAPPIVINVPEGELMSETMGYARGDKVTVAVESYARSNNISRSLKDITLTVEG